MASNTAKRYLKIWWALTTKSWQVALTSRFGAFAFITAKILRFTFFIFFIFILFSKTNLIGEYNFWQAILFFATFNLVDTLAQFFMREVYRFRWYIISGEFDHFLTKPISPLLRSLFGGIDVLDFPVILISVGVVAITLKNLEDVSLLGIIIYIALVANALIIAVAAHIFVIASGVITAQIDNTLWFYRDLTQMGRIPIDLYREPIRWILTFIVPVGIMMTIPAKALMGGLSWQWIIIPFVISITFLVISLKFWYFALKNYTSIST